MPQWSGRARSSSSGAAMSSPGPATNPRKPTGMSSTPEVGDGDSWRGRRSPHARTRHRLGRARSSWSGEERTGARSSSSTTARPTTLGPTAGVDFLERRSGPVLRSRSGRGMRSSCGGRRSASAIDPATAPRTIRGEHVAKDRERSDRADRRERGVDRPRDDRLRGGTPRRELPGDEDGDRRCVRPGARHLAATARLDSLASGFHRCMDRNGVVAWDYGNSTGAYDPRTNDWRELPDVPLDAGECAPNSIPVGRLVFGDYCGGLVVYEPSMRSLARHLAPRPPRLAARARRSRPGGALARTEPGDRGRADARLSPWELTAGQDGVTRYASKTASRFRSAPRSDRRSFTSPTSAVYQLRAIPSWTTPP